ncbi:MAG: glycosyltransferase family 4 protein [Firmicutes bacterium]|nr:glycosyltransferase family 4 protein [Bacillota bacterium]
MNIVIIRTNVSDFGKIGTYNVQEIGLANSLKELGHKVDVIYLYKKVNKIELDSTYNFVWHLPNRHFGLHGIFDLTLLEQFEPNKIILFSDNQLYSRNIIFWAKKRKIKCIVYWGAVLSTTPKIINKIYTYIIYIRNRRSYKYSLNVAKTSTVAKEMKKLKIVCNNVINIGLDNKLLREFSADLNSTRDKLKINKNDKLILFIGRLEEAKKPLFAIDLILNLVKKDSSFKLLMIGKGSLLEKVQQKIIDSTISNNVILIDSIKNYEIHKYIMISNCFINLSSIEIFGMAMLEAMYYGIPVIAKDAPGPREFIINNSTGFILNNYDINDWINCILLVMSDTKTIVRNARKLVTDKFTWNNNAILFDKL